LQIEFQLWDISGDDVHDRFGNLSYSGSDVVLACFAIDRPESIASIAERWVPKVRHHCPSTPIILVGCKSDLRRLDNSQSDETPSEGESSTNLQCKPGTGELLSSEEGCAMATRVGACIYLETSAKTKYGVEALLTLAGKIALEVRKLGSPLFGIYRSFRQT
jgi:GTPase SAR1 family protein